MKIDLFIQKLNQRQDIATLTTANLDHFELTEEEKTFIKAYQPEKVLIVYGTLAPGRQNHYVVEHIKGEWKQGMIRGKLVNAGWGANLGYKAFRHTSAEEQEEIIAFVLFSDELITNWKMLDEFEGEGYKRILAQFELNNGDKGAGYIYASNEAEMNIE